VPHPLQGLRRDRWRVRLMGDDLTLDNLFDAIERLRQGKPEQLSPLVVPRWVMDDPVALAAARREAALWGFDGVISWPDPRDSQEVPGG